MSQKERVLTALMSGERLTSKQIAARFSVANPTAVISALRFEGFPIYKNPRTNSKGETRNFYRLGSPTRAVIAAGYRAMASV